jgi:hypothetical protein
MVIIPKYSNNEIDVPRAPLSDLSLFPIFQTRTDYENFTGKPCPQYNPAKDAKYWFDPDPNSEWDEGYWVIYPYSSDIEVKNGVPVKPRKLVVKKVDVGTVNIPFGVTNEPGTGNIVPFPIRKLTENEALEIGFGGAVTVINKKLVDITEDPSKALKLVISKLDIIYSAVLSLEHRLKTVSTTGYSNPVNTSTLVVGENKEGCCD